MKLARTVTALLGLAILQSACGQVPVLWGSSPAPACGQGQGTPAGGASQLAAASQSFGLGLARQLAAQPADNVFISPVSAQLALAMAAEGARGDTQRAMLDALGLHQLTADQVARQARLLIDRLTAGGCATVEIANSVWARPWLSLDAGYVRTVKSQFHGQTGALNGDSPSAINDWAARATHGKITSILERIPPEVLLYVVNATYFHGNWQTAFDPHSTREAPLHRAAGGDVHVLLMDHSGQFRYGEGPGYQAVALPYRGGSTRMLVVLPATSLSAAGFAPYLDPARLQQVGGTLQADRTGDLRLPRFAIDSRSSLAGPLAALGMAPALEAAADFSGLVPDCRDQCHISEVTQKAYIKVDENGTTAAAATEGAVATALRTKFHMVVDRPFLAAIQDTRTGALLFVGVIGDPTRS
jgi:serpin B